MVHSYNDCEDPNSDSNKEYVHNAFKQSPEGDEVTKKSEHSSKQMMKELVGRGYDGKSPMGDVLSDYTTAGVDWPYLISHSFCFVGKYYANRTEYLNGYASCPAQGGEGSAVWYCGKLDNSWYKWSSGKVFLFWLARPSK